MSEVSETYRRLSEAFAKKIENVDGDQWSAQSPCADWKARDIVEHVVSTQGMFLGFISEEIGEIPSPSDDPAGAWRAASGKVQSILDDPKKAGTEFEAMMGKSTFEKAVDTFLNTDLVVHRWDLARATSQDDTIADEDNDGCGATWRRWATSSADRRRSDRRSKYPTARATRTS